MDKNFQLRWKGKITGPYTKDQIDAQLNSRKIGSLCEINYDGKWMLLDEFNVAYENEAEKLRLEAEGRVRKQRGDRARQEEEDLKREKKEESEEKEKQAERKHQRELELLGTDQHPPPLPPTVTSTATGTTPQSSPWGKTSVPAKSGGFGIFVAIVLGVLWYQGYLDPGDIPALWGNSKYIDVVRNDKPPDYGGDTVGQSASEHLTSVTWKSSRGGNRNVIIISVSGKSKEDGKPRRKRWIVNKRDRAYEGM